MCAATTSLIGALRDPIRASAYNAMADLNESPIIEQDVARADTPTPW